jgi:predicted acetyltransferase
MALTIRTLVEDDYEPFVDMVASAFLFDPNEKDAESERPLYDLDRVHGVFDGTEIIGAAGILTRDVTVPGRGPQPTAAITSVGVKPGHRRRGALSMLMRAELHGLHDEGREAFASLWASEGSIYGRYGYGLAAEYAALKIPRGAAFHAGVDVGTDRVREVPREQAWAVIRAVYERVAPSRTGYLSRSDASWDHFFADAEQHRNGLTKYRFVLHPGGYAVYRVKGAWGERGPENELHIRELVAEDDQAYAALWRYLLDVDLVQELSYFTGTGEPVTHLLANPQLAIRTRRDSLWIRLVDLDRALPQRQYASDVDVVLDVTDELCPWNADRWRFTVKSGEASVRRVTDEPDVVLDVTALGAAFIGGTRLTTLARAQYLRELTPGAVRALSNAFLGDEEPHCLEVF